MPPDAKVRPHKEYEYGPRPLCKCGCNRRLKRGSKFYYSRQCIPGEQRALWNRVGLKTRSYRQQASLFRRLFDKVLAGRDAISREIIYAFGGECYRLGYKAGFARASQPRATTILARVDVPITMEQAPPTLSPQSGIMGHDAQ